MRASLQLDGSVPVLRIETDSRGGKASEFYVSITHTYAKADGKAVTTTNTFSGFAMEDLETLAAVIDTIRKEYRNDRTEAAGSHGRAKRLGRSSASSGR